MVIDHLQKRGLVLRERGVLDKRYFTIHLTSEGEVLIEDIFPKILSLIKNEVNVLNEKEQLDFQRMCKLVGIKEN